MRIIGVDPGTATVGYGIIDVAGNKNSLVDVGIVSTAKDLSDAARLRLISVGLEKLIKKYKPQVLVAEKIYFSKNIKTAISVAQARGVILLTAEKAGLDIIECSPQDVKLSVTGYGNADKQQVQKMVKVLLNLKSIPKPDDAADALAAALAVAHLKRSLK